MRRYVEFTVWNLKEERPATPQEIAYAIKIEIDDDGKCSIEGADGYSILTDY